MFYIIAPFVGVGAAGTSSTAILTILNNWFDKKYGLASGLALSFSGIGGALLAPVFAAIIELIGWRMAYLAAAGAAAVASVPGIIFILRKTPGEKNLLPYGGHEAKAAQADAKKKRSHSLRELFSITFVAICMMGFLASGMTSVNSHLPGYAEELGFSVSVGALMVTCCMVGNVSSKLLLGVLCDTLGAVKGCLIMSACVIASLVAFLTAPVEASWLPLVSAVLFGAVFSLGGIGQSQLIRHVYGPEKFASVYALSSMFPYLGAAIMNSVFGYVYDFSGSYRGALLIALGMAVIALITTLCVSRRKKAA